MNKPSEHYCYVPERYRKYNYKIIKAFRDKVIKYIVENPDGVRLPNNLGDIKILGFEPEVGYKDEKLSKEYGKDIYFENAHTDGLVFKFIWYAKYVQGLKRKTGGFKNSRFYRFHASKPLKKKLKEWIRAGNWKNYGVVETRQDIKA